MHTHSHTRGYGGAHPATGCLEPTPLLGLRGGQPMPCTQKKAHTHTRERERTKNNLKEITKQKMHMHTQTHPHMHPRSHVGSRHTHFSAQVRRFCVPHHRGVTTFSASHSAQSFLRRSVIDGMLIRPLCLVAHAAWPRLRLLPCHNLLKAKCIEK